MSQIDLLNPTDPKDLREAFVPVYVETLKRKATGVLWRLSQAEGDEAVTSLIERVRDKDSAVDTELARLAGS
jgi:hypothetical protein